MDIRIVGLDGLPEVHPGDDLAGLILAAGVQARETIAHETIVVVAQKIVSKAEARSLILVKFSLLNSPHDGPGSGARTRVSSN
jgi:F420-0:gamma-glutamyl ligase